MPSSALTSAKSGSRLRILLLLLLLTTGGGAVVLCDWVQKQASKQASRRGIGNTVGDMLTLICSGSCGWCSRLLGLAEGHRIADVGLLLLVFRSANSIYVITLNLTCVFPNELGLARLRLCGCGGGGSGGFAQIQTILHAVVRSGNVE